jgi:hypothetical protein
VDVVTRERALRTSDGRVPYHRVRAKTDHSCLLCRRPDAIKAGRECLLSDFDGSRICRDCEIEIDSLFATGERFYIPPRRHGGDIPNRGWGANAAVRETGLDPVSQIARGTNTNAMAAMKRSSDEAKFVTCPECGYGSGRHSRMCSAQ